MYMRILTFRIGATQITFDNLIPLIFVAERLEIYNVLEEIDDFVKLNIKNQHVAQLIVPSIKYKVERLTSHLIELMATNFSDFVDEAHFKFSFSTLPYEAMNRLLHHTNLLVANEGHMFQAIQSFLSQFKEGELSEEMLISIYENLRFECLDYSVLESALNHPMVPKSLLSQALMLRLANFESPRKLNNSVEDGLRKRRSSYGRVFQPSGNDIDKKGVLYYIATEEYREEWKNPHLTYMVQAEWSSLEKGSVECIFEKEPRECWSQDVPSSWLQIDLGPSKSLRITHYTLRHGSNSKQDLIRNWILKASSDGKEYDTLKRHKDDESLVTPFGSKTWSIHGCKKRYRYFKIVQIGHNSSKHNFLSLSGVEFYGELIYENNVE